MSGILTAFPGISTAAGGGGGLSVTDDFNSYTAGQLMSTNPGPGWSLRTGDFQYVVTGEITGTTGGGIACAAYEPSGFTTAADHQVEVILGAGAGGGSNAHGAACAMQADGACYHVYTDTNNAFFGYADGSGAGSQYKGTFAHGLATLAGVKLRLTVTGAGATRRVTAEMDIGAGYVTPSGWGNVDFGAGFRLDGGQGGIVGYNNAAINKITSITVRN